MPKPNPNATEEGRMQRFEREMREKTWVYEALIHRNHTGMPLGDIMSLETVTKKVATLSYSRVRDILNDLRHENKVEVVNLTGEPRYRLSSSERAVLTEQWKRGQPVDQHGQGETGVSSRM